MDLSVVLLSYNTRDLTAQALRTVVDASAGLEVEIFVVDNDSHDGSADMVAEKFPQVKLLRNAENLGFAAGNNVALRQVSGRHVLLLNTDTIVRRDTLRTMVEFLDAHLDVGALGCKILNPDGTLQYDCKRGFPTPMAAIYKLTGLSRLFPKSPRFARYDMTYVDEDETAEVDALSGSCTMVRKETMDQVGLLDEDYFMYGEDLDWYFRMHKAGWKTYYLPTTEIIHFRGESGRAHQWSILYRKTAAMSIFVHKNMRDSYRFFPLWLLHLGIAFYGLYSVAVHLAKKIALPALDGILVLIGLKLGLDLRYHAALRSLMQDIERLGLQLGLDAYPTHWPVPPAYTDFEWFLIYAVPLCTWLLAFYLVGLYRRHRFSVLRSAVAVAAGFTAIITMVFFFKAYNFSRLAAGAAWVFNTALIAGWRAGAQWFLQTRSGSPLNRRRTLLVGADDETARFLAHLEKAGGLLYEVIGLVGQRQEERGLLVAGKQVVGLVEDLERLVEDYAIEELIFTSSHIAHSLLASGATWRRRNMRIHLVPGPIETLLGGREPKNFADLPLVEIAPCS